MLSKALRTSRLMLFAVSPVINECNWVRSQRGICRAAFLSPRIKYQSSTGRREAISSLFIKATSLAQPRDRSLDFGLDWVLLLLTHVKGVLWGNS